MDSRTEFEDDEHFFESYEEHARTEGSLASPEFDEAEDRPTAEQLAHVTRFRKPVGWAVAGLTLFSIVALGLQGSQRDSQRELVAHYASALPAPTSAAIISVAESVIGPDEPTGPDTAGSEISSSTEPGPESRRVIAFTSSLTAMCLRQVDSDVTLLLRSNGIPPRPTLDLSRARGQDQDSWSLPLSMMWSSLSARP